MLVEEGVHLVVVHMDDLRTIQMNQDIHFHYHDHDGHGHGRGHVLMMDDDQ